MTAVNARSPCNNFATARLIRISGPQMDIVGVFGKAQQFRRKRCQ